MFKKCLVGAGFVALATVALLAVPGTSEGGPFGRRGVGTGSTINDVGSSVSYGDPYYSQPSYTEGNRVRFGFRRRNSTPYNYSPYDYSAMPPGYVAAGSDTATYSTSGYRPGDAANALKSTDDRARLRIAIPSGKAEIWIEGEKSEQSKRVEDYVSPPLTPGKQYYYEVRARWTDPAGKQVERTRSFPIRPGQPVFLDLRRPDTADQGAKPGPREEIPRPKQ